MPNVAILFFDVMAKRKNKTAKVRYTEDGRLKGISVPYSPSFVRAAKEAGYRWNGKYWSEDIRLLATGERGLTPQLIEQWMDEQRQAVVELASTFFELEHLNDEQSNSH